MSVILEINRNALIMCPIVDLWLDSSSFSWGDKFLQKNYMNATWTTTPVYQWPYYVFFFFLTGILYTKRSKFRSAQHFTRQFFWQSEISCLSNATSSIQPSGKFYQYFHELLNVELKLLACFWFRVREDFLVRLLFSSVKQKGFSIDKKRLILFRVIISGHFWSFPYVWVDLQCD